MGPSQASIFDAEYDMDVKPSLEEEATLADRRENQDVKPSMSRGKIPREGHSSFMGLGAFLVPLSLTPS